MSQTFRVICLSEAVSPITHMSRSEGNESLVAREPVVTPRGILWVPHLSGNAIRHRCIREPGARWLIHRYELGGKLTLPQLNFLFHGGNLTEGGGREDTRRIADMQRLFPLLRLLGGCLPDQVLAGSLNVHRGLLVCEENRAAMEAELKPLAWELLSSPLRPAESFVSGYQYVRNDAAKSSRDLLPPALANGELFGDGEPAKEAKSNQMIFAGQAVTRGAIFLHGFTLAHVSRLELGALLLSMLLWQKAGGTVGGQAARGHGRLETQLAVAGNDEPFDAFVSEYVAHVDANKGDAVAWLNQPFSPPKADKPKKNKKAKDAATSEPAEVSSDG